MASKGFCTIIGGPNGSGKSTVFSLVEPKGEFVNADIIARRLNPDSPEAASLAAGRLILQRLAQLMAAQESFVYETTLSSRQSLTLMSECRALGYEVALLFVALDGPDLNVRRVKERVARGGHDIPEAIVRRRYEKAFENLPEAIKLADRILIFDNSKQKSETVLVIDFGTIRQNWLNSESELHIRIAEAAASALGVSRDEFFSATNRK